LINLVTKPLLAKILRAVYTAD